jgi:hypothetical protein
MNDNFELLGSLFASFGVVSLIIIIFAIVIYWKVFEKANRPGWAAIIPIYNTIVTLQVAGLSPWLVLVLLASIIPVVGTIVLLIFNIYVSIKLAQAFGKSALFGIGIAFLPIIFVAILAFGDAKYQLGNNEQSF